MAATKTIEAVELDTRTGLWCGACCRWTLVEVDVAIIDAETLEVLRRVTGSVCLGCGAEDG